MVPGTDGKTEHSPLPKTQFLHFLQKGNFIPIIDVFALSWEGFLLCWGKLWIILLPHPTPYSTFISPGGMTKPSRSRQVSSTRLHAMPPIIHPSLLWLSPSKQHLLQNQPLSHTPSKLVFLSTSNRKAWITNRAYRPSLHSGQFVSLP